MVDSVIDFIKKFHPSTLELGPWEILAIVGLIIVGLVLTHWIVSFLPTHTGNLVKVILTRTLSIVSYGFIILMILNAILTRDYGSILVVILLWVSSRIDYWYKLYDNFVDKRMDRGSEKRTRND